MGWRKLPAWLKGGEIGLGIGIILLGFLAFLNPNADIKIIFTILILSSILGVSLWISIGKIKSTKLPYWIKGGIISLLVLFIIGILPSALYRIFTNCYGEDCFLADIWLSLFSLPILFLRGLANYISWSILIFLFYFLIGALIGFLVGKMKSKK